MKKISIIIPVYNEEEAIPLLIAKTSKVLKKLHYRFELLFVNDGSTDNTQSVLNKASKSSGCISYIEFSRNFGKEFAILAGIESSKADAVVIMDGDLEHPPESISEMIKSWNAGYEVVVGINTNNGNIIRKFFNSIFYKIINYSSELKLKPGESDYCLLDKAVCEVLKNCREVSRFNRALVNWLGFRRAYFEFKSGDRMFGKSSYPISKIMALAFDSYLANNLTLLKTTGCFGFLIMALSGIFGAFIIVEKYVLDDIYQLNFSGPAQLAVLSIFLIGLVLSSIGLTSVYIKDILSQVKGRPLFVIRSKKCKR